MMDDLIVSGELAEAIIAGQQDIKTLLLFIFIILCVIFGAYIAGAILRHLFKGW